MSLPFIRTAQGNLNVVVHGKNFAVPSDHPNYTTLLDAVKNGDEKSFLKNVDIPKTITRRSGNLVEVVGGEVLYKGKPLHNIVTSRILEFMSQSLPFQPLVNFLEKLQENPSKSSVDECYLFLESCGLTICEDGDFLGFKSVYRDASGNLVDHYSKRFINNPGTVNEMPRNQVCDKRDRACSYGFHIGTSEYSNSFGGSNGIMLMVKVNPRDVVSVPSDYSNQKLRACRYEVVKEIPRESGYDSGLYSNTGDPYIPSEKNEEDNFDDLDDLDESYDAGYYDGYQTAREELEEEYEVISKPKRDSNGRFTR